MYQRPSAPLPIGGVLDNAIRLLKASFRQVIGLAVASSLLANSWRLFVNLEEIRAVATLAGATGTVNPFQAIGWGFVPWILGGLAGTYLHVVIIARMHAFSTNRPTTLGEAFRRALIRFPAIFLCGLAIVGGSAAIGIIMAIAIVGFGVGGAFFALLVLPLGLLLVYWLLALLLPVTDNIGALQALRRSVHLVVGNFWRTLTLITVIIFIDLAATAAVSALAATLGALAGFGNLSYDAVFFVVSLIVSSVITPFLAAAMLALLHDLELRREGADLAQRIKAL